MSGAFLAAFCFSQFVKPREGSTLDRVFASNARFYTAFYTHPRATLACQRSALRAALAESPHRGKAMATAEELALDELVAPMHFSPQLEAAIQEVRT